MGRQQYVCPRISGQPGCVCNHSDGVIDLTIIANNESASDFSNSNAGSAFEVLLKTGSGLLQTESLAVREYPLRFKYEKEIFTGLLEGQYSYDFNPCYRFTDTRCSNVYICQFEIFIPSFTFEIVDEGEQIMIDPSDSRGQVYLQYRISRGRWIAKVYLHCDQSRTTPFVIAVGEPITLTYVFELYSCAACPGGCVPCSVPCPIGDNCTAPDSCNCTTGWSSTGCTAALTPTCAALQKLSESVQLLDCNRNDQCDTVYCNVTNPYVQTYVSVVRFTIMPCNLPPAVRMSGNNTSGGVVLDSVLSQLHNTFPLQRGVTLNISVFQLDNAIGFEANVISTLILAGATFTIVPYVRVPIDTSGCSSATQIVIISNSTAITAGSMGIFMCTASGYPLPALSWSRGGVSLSNGSWFIIYKQRVTWSEVTYVQSTLEISSVESDDAAEYTCVANNTFSSTTANFNLTVNQFSQVSAVAITGSVFAAMGVILLCIGSAIFVVNLRRRKHQAENKNRTDEISTRNNTVILCLLARAMERGYFHGCQMIHELYTDVPKLIISSSCIRLLNIVGQGEFGVVYRAHLVRSFQRLPDTVAVKTLKGFFDQKTAADMVKESLKMEGFEHPHVLSIIGVCVDAGPAPYIIMPFMANGSLLAYIKKEKTNLVVLKDNDLVTVAQKRLADMCIQIAKGMEYLAEKKIVHRDLAARNCMIDTHFIIKVADFGLSESLYSKSYFRQEKKQAVKLPVKWLALEALTEGVFSEKSDVWSYGVTCWELFTGGKIPYPGVDPVFLSKHLESGHRLDKPNNAACSEEIYLFMCKCWHADPKERPTFSELVSSMSQTLESLAGYMDVLTFGEVEAHHEDPDGDTKVN